MRRVAVIIAVSLLLLACRRPPDVWTAKRIVALEYPVLGTAARIQGMVKVTAVIDGNGNVHEVMHIEGEGISNHPLLYKAVRDNLLKWKFERPPGNTLLPSPILTYTFKLEGATRGQRKQEFVFEHPGMAFVVSEAMCP